MRHLDSNRSCPNKESSLITSSITEYGLLTSQAAEFKDNGCFHTWWIGHVLKRGGVSPLAQFVWAHVNTTVALGCETKQLSRARHEEEEEAWLDSAGMLQRCVYIENTVDQNIIFNMWCCFLNHLFSIKQDGPGVTAREYHTGLKMTLWDNLRLENSFDPPFKEHYLIFLSTFFPKTYFIAFFSSHNVTHQVECFTLSMGYILYVQLGKCQ